MKCITQMLSIICIVVSQKHFHGAYLTECQGQDINGFVLLDNRVTLGRAVTYLPYIKSDAEEYMHGKILGIAEAPKPSAAVADTSAPLGKESE